MSCLFFLIVAISFSDPPAGRIVVRVEDLRDTTGLVVAALFRNPETFLKKPIVSKRASPGGRTATLVFENLPPGEYAISVFHDRNKNGELDTNALGIPTEGFGFGNDAMGLFGPPSFRKASMTVGDEEVLATVNLRYY